MYDTQNDPYAVTSWGPNAKEPFDVVTPSGQRCLVRKLEMDDILSSGILNDLDSFTAALVAEETPSSEVDPKEMMKLFADKEKFGKMVETMDKVLVLTVLRPTILPVPAEGVSRETGKAYVDQVNFMDKMAIFSQVFDGLSGMGEFREEQEAGVGTVANEQTLQSAAESAPGTTA